MESMMHPSFFFERKQKKCFHYSLKICFTPNSLIRSHFSSPRWCFESIFARKKGPCYMMDFYQHFRLNSFSSREFIERKQEDLKINPLSMPSTLLSGYHTYTHNATAHTTRSTDKILTVKYEDGAWTKPYYDCGGGNIWMMTYTVPFFGFENGQYFFK